MAGGVEMSEHTPEPWFLGKKVDQVTIGGHRHEVYPIEDEEFGVAACILPFVDISEKTRRMVQANARRIVACVNACQGLKTEDIEGRNFWTDDTVTANTVFILTQERDLARAMVPELRAALHRDHHALVEIWTTHPHLVELEAQGEECPTCQLINKAETQQ